ncbi:hypothetical protein [Paenarthrobacter nitroguajacolicus]|uniref:hypothetical protein n=1 Tax=Paenarthrobacter nitroguajacolicus TaxID=211146 RepID=UPI00248BD84F|nr:hypothetical protein [Paenarthrobacter nitroguajacolicus]MDI2035064.1 hypothetical protein [Paenarthrobacter nitroguajacolicus]
MAFNVRRRLAGPVALGTIGVVLAACSVNVPDPSAPKPSPSESTLATPTITPGHDADAVAAKDLPLAAGGTLAAGDPVTVASKLEEVPGWSVVHSGLQGEDLYRKSDGCTLSARVSVNQGPLVVAGDDAASTKALFHYLDAGIDAENLKPASLRWGQDSDKPQHSVEFLALESSAATGAKPVVVLARLFSAPASSVYISLACPDDATLAKARADVEAKLAVIPPS